MKILLACCAGMSTSLLVKSMREACQAAHKDYQIWAVDKPAISSELGNFDVLLLGPQVSFIKDDVKKMVGDSVPVEIIPSIDYGRCNGEAVVKFAEKLLEKEKENECAR